jgi:hypothetical protein
VNGLVLNRVELVDVEREEQVRLLGLGLEEGVNDGG